MSHSRCSALPRSARASTGASSTASRRRTARPSTARPNSHAGRWRSCTASSDFLARPEATQRRSEGDRIAMTEAAPAQDVLYAVANHIATITLNRPHRRNALNFPAYDQLEASFRKAAGDPEVRCIVVTGTDPAFCSGDDVGEI